jgi:hypothetical protein
MGVIYYGWYCKKEVEKEKGNASVESQEAA